MPKKHSYQINSAQLFLTYPQCPLEKQVVYDFLQNLFAPDQVEIIIVAHELHQNGDSHLHCYLKLFRAHRTTDPTFADLPGGYHGNYQGCHSAKNVIRYCTKADDYLSNVDVGPLITKANKKRTIMESIITGKRTLNEVIHENPEYLVGYTKLKLDLANFLQDQANTKPSLPPFLPNPWGKILSTSNTRKRRHYWIYSRLPNFGKTFHFAKPITREFRAAIFAGNQPYWNLRGDEQVIFLDEYNSAAFKYHELNAMADGTYSYRRFHLGVISLQDPIIIILSNQSITDLYPFMHELLYARFNEIELMLGDKAAIS